MVSCFSLLCCYAFVPVCMVSVLSNWGCAVCVTCAVSVVRKGSSVMKRMSLIVTLVSVVAGTVVAAPRAGTVRDLEAVKSTFQEISGRLDQGGDLFIVANMEGALEEAVGYMSELASLAPAEPDASGKTPAEMVEKAAAFLKKNGFYAVNGAGMSVVPRADGLNAVKLFLSRDAAGGMLPLWRGLVGTAPSDMNCLSYLPKDTVAARSGTADINALWAMVKGAVSEFGGPEAEQQLTMGLAMAEKTIGTSVDAILASLATEAVTSLQLSSTATAPVPVGLQTVDIPAPSLLIVMAVKDDTILDTVKRAFATQLEMPLPEVHVGDAVLHTLPFPIPSPVPIQITLAKHGKYLLLGTTTAVVTDAINAATKQDGLKATAEYKTAFAGAPEKNNGVGFVSKRLGKTIADVQGGIMKQMAAADPNAKDATEFMNTWMAERFSSVSAFTVMNYRSGVKVSGVSSSGGREMVGGLMMAPMGLMASIAMPSFIKARTVSQQNACINNLRQLDSAKEQWAMVKNAADGAAPVEAEVLEYIKGAAMPTCPDGGTYTLNPIGESPACSDPEHVLAF
jgi:hypothetical protein